MWHGRVWSRGITQVFSQVLVTQQDNTTLCDEKYYYKLQGVLKKTCLLSLLDNSQVKVAKNVGNCSAKIAHISQLDIFNKS